MLHVADVRGVRVGTRNGLVPQVSPLLRDLGEDHIHDA